MVPIVRGNAKEANTSERMRGWIVGHMHQGRDLVGTPEFEVKLWHYEKPFDYGKKRFDGTELVVIYGGALRFDMEYDSGEKVTSESVEINGESHEYIVFPPHTTKTVVVVEGPAFGVTVRWPSGPGVNKVI